MINLLRLTDDFFDSKNLSNSKLKAFTEEHLVRLSNPGNNPGGMYNTMIADTTTKYNNYYGKISNEYVKKAMAEGATISKREALKKVETRISELQSLIKYEFEDDKDIYEEFFPHGMNEYYQARESGLNLLFDRFLAAANKHLAGTYPAEVTELTNLINAFNTAYRSRESIVGQVAGIKSGRKEDRKALTLQLTANFLIIASNNVDNPVRFHGYYEGRYLPK